MLPADPASPGHGSANLSVVVMARAPLADAKTRLASVLTPEQRAALVTAMLEDVLEMVSRVAASQASLSPVAASQVSLPPASLPPASLPPASLPPASLPLASLPPVASPQASPSPASPSPASPSPASLSPVDSPQASLSPADSPQASPSPASLSPVDAPHVALSGPGAAEPSYTRVLPLHPPARLLLACAPDIEQPLFVSLSAQYGCERVAQGEGDLGWRMARAIGAALKGAADGATLKGAADDAAPGTGAAGPASPAMAPDLDFSAVLVLGSDSPTLPPEVLEQAMRALETADVVFGPAADGGYYLVGMKRLEPTIFADIPWSGPEVLAVSLERARAAGLSVALLPEWYDVDVPEDLDRVRGGARGTHGIAPGAWQAGRRTIALVSGWVEAGGGGDRRSES